MPNVRHAVVLRERRGHQLSTRVVPSTAGREPRSNETVAAIVALQVEYASWLEALPDNQQESVPADASRVVAELDLSELQAIEPPRGFGRD